MSGLFGALPLLGWASGMAGTVFPGNVSAQGAETLPFSWDGLVARLVEQSKQPYKPLQSVLSPAMSALGYDQHRDIRFRPDRALWKNQSLRFEGQFFHPGFLFRTPVSIFEVTNGTARPIGYDRSLFDIGPVAAPALPEGETAPGFAGFRLHYPLNSPDVFDELIVFLGGSYFRALGRNSLFGLSARGLAVNTATANGEEFPEWRSFWLERPVPGSDQMRLYAELESPSVTGAFAFTITPGRNSVVDVEARLFARADIERFGVAPLTSMYLFGENDRSQHDDFRPEVHDSDGLYINTGTGEWLWRPLNNPPKLRVNSYIDNRPRGFGLLQRDRDFNNYQDAEAQYHRRPSVWVEPLDDWGPGSVQLVEIPSPSEIHDNIVAYWVPGSPVLKGQERRFRYRLIWGDTPALGPDLGLVVASRTGVGGYSGNETSDPTIRKFVVDCRGGMLATINQKTVIEASVTVINGELTHPPVVVPLPDGAWRMLFDVRRGSAENVDLRAFLKIGDRTLTETWSYQWTP
jgi:glucans biosynthesis protein